MEKSDSCCYTMYVLAFLYAFRLMKHFCFNLIEFRLIYFDDFNLFLITVSDTGCETESTVFFSIEMVQKQYSSCTSVQASGMKWHALRSILFICTAHVCIWPMFSFIRRVMRVRSKTHVHISWREKKVLILIEWKHKHAIWFLVIFILCILCFISTFFSSILYLCVFSRTALFVTFGFPFQIYSMDECVCAWFHMWFEIVWFIAYYYYYYCESSLFFVDYARMCWNLCVCEYLNGYENTFRPYERNKYARIVCSEFYFVAKKQAQCA